MAKSKSKPPKGQTPLGGLMPKPPKNFDQWPFYYASLQCQWVYWYTDIEAAEPYVKGTGLKVAQFPTDEGNKAVVLLNFQRYSAHYNNSMGLCNEVEFNLVAYPANREPGVPFMTVEEWLNGDDQTKTLGHLRVHVAADNAVAVEAGRAAFGEPKFLGNFVYDVPTLNAKPNYDWKIRLVNPENPDEYVYDMFADFKTMDFWPTQCTPIPEFACGLGRTVWTRWTIMGQFQTAMLSTARDKKRVKLKIGDNDFQMTKDMRALIGDKNQPIACQTFDSIPGCIEPLGFYVDGINRDDTYG